MDAQAVADNLQRLYDSIPKEGVRCMKEAISDVNAVRSGTMRDTVRADEMGAIVEIHTSVMYDKFVEDGRRAFSVPAGGTTKNGFKWLHWPADSKGPEVFTKKVGPVWPRHFASRTVEKIEAYIATF